jgi:hypothetical protein
MQLPSAKNTYTLSAILCLFMLAAFFNSLMDVLQFRYSKSIFAQHGMNQEFFDPDLSWKNKWQNGNPEEGEAYPGSSTVFVLFTDAWHLFQFLMFTCFEVIILILIHKIWKLKWYAYALLFLGMKFLFGLTFELFFSRVLVA